MTVNDQNRYASALCLQGIRHFQQGAYSQAMDCLNQGLHLWQETDKNILAEGIALGYLGQLYAKQQQYWFAHACYQAALSACRSHNSVKSRLFQAQIYGWLADMCRHCGYDDLVKTHHATAALIRQELRSA
ncbi:hypothetical protein VB780_12435 [Leptolyngbya sp. CCNP1308]|nr:hypothetical protein [Leptolyngbya sp. CCNP1308]